MKGTHHKNALISAIMAICLSAALLGANVVFGATPTLNPPGSGITPTFTGLTVNGASNLNGQVTASGIVIKNSAGEDKFMINLENNLIKFYDKYFGNWTPSIVLKGGNVGIGVNNPESSKLAVNGDIVVDSAFINGYLSVSADTQIDMNLNVDGSAAIAGNVGIGTTNPQDKLDVAGGDIRLDSGKEIFFEDNGQIRSSDDNHRILFRRSENKMELREYGDIVFSPGSRPATPETAKATITSAGHFKTTGGIGAFSSVTGTPQIVPWASSQNAYVSCPSGIPISCGFTSTESPTLYITMVTMDAGQCKVSAKNSITAAQLYPSMQIIQATAVCFDSNG